MELVRFLLVLFVDCFFCFWGGFIKEKNGRFFVLAKLSLRRARWWPFLFVVVVVVVVVVVSSIFFLFDFCSYLLEVLFGVV